MNPKNTHNPHFLHTVIVQYFYNRPQPSSPFGCSIHPQGELLPTVKIRTLTKEEAPQGRNQEELQAQRCAV
tara:strand:- start:16 stop:228 length:213 start_codon:yes stop_codon:yes gene_type:complete